ncbi:MAG: DUF58 domain-containing protein [Chitinophagales bacterium]
MLSFFKSLFIHQRFFVLLGLVVLLFMLAYSYPALLGIAKLAVFALVLGLLIDMTLLYRIKKGLFGYRETPELFSNGDQNDVHIYLENYYPFNIQTQIIDELPFQFQRRDVSFIENLKTAASKSIVYQLRPTERGEYHFGALNVLVASPLSLVNRRYVFSADKMVPVYPSFLQMRKFELIAFSNQKLEYGIKKIRRIGHSMEFEQIKEYVMGDDYRIINWKATARRNQLMVNQFQDEKSQQIFSIIDSGRVMKMPFEGMSLLDYAVNASLVISNIAIKKGDKAGLVTFAEKMGILLPAKNQMRQMRTIQEGLFNLQTRFLESDYEKLYANIRHKINRRSLLLLFTNFESLSALQRQLPSIRKIAKRHLVVVIFFENTELKELLEAPADGVLPIYQKTIAEKFAFEKRQIVKELQLHGIQAILTSPQNLTVNTINKYLELKSRGLI